MHLEDPNVRTNFAGESSAFGRDDKRVGGLLEDDGPIPKIARVALFTDTFSEVNGAAHTLRKVAEMMERLGIPLDVYCYGPEEGVEVRGCVTIRRFNHRLAHNYYERMSIELAPDFRIGKAWRDAMQSNPYTVVHLATPGSMGFTGRNLAARFGVPVVGTYHTHFSDYTGLRSGPAVRKVISDATRNFLRWFYAPCKWVLCPTEGCAQDLQRKGFRNRLGVFSRGIDTELYSTSKRKRTDDRIVTAYVGRCAPEKNVQALPEIVEGIESELWVIGDGPERPILEQKLKHGRFTGYLYGEELATAYADVELLLFPSTTDTFGNVVLEAMASGVVPIVARGPGPSDFVTDGLNAMVCDGPQGMRSALRKLVADGEMRTSMRKQAVDYARQRDWQRAVKGLVRYYGLAANP
jgi:glycosyltransferase involved in cell wall biosynthesis